MIFISTFHAQVGIVSASENSKRGFVAAILRLLEPTGVVRIDGINIAEIGLYDLRRHIAVVPQVSRSMTKLNIGGEHISQELNTMQ